MNMAGNMAIFECALKQIKVYRTYYVDSTWFICWIPKLRCFRDETLRKSFTMRPGPYK